MVYCISNIVYKSVNDKGLLLSKILANRNTDVMNKTFWFKVLKKNIMNFLIKMKMAMLYLLILTNIMKSKKNNKPVFELNADVLRLNE